MEIVSITDSLTARGLKLAGVNETFVADSREGAKRAFEKILEMDSVGVVIITEQLAQKINNELTNFRESKERVTPIVIEISGREGPVEERRKVIEKLVKRAVGVKVES